MTNSQNTSYKQPNYDYSILSDFFPTDAINQFRESAINPIIALLNAEFVDGGDKAIAELLHAIPNSWKNAKGENVYKFTHSNALNSDLKRTYDPVIKDGGISFRGKAIDGVGITKCLSFKPATPRVGKDGKPIKYENPPKSVSQVLLPLIDIDTWKSISSRCGVEIPSDVEINREWQAVEIGGDEWREYHELDLGTKYVKWLLNNPQVPIAITEGAKKADSVTSVGFVVAGLGGVWNGCEKIDKEKDNKDESNYKLITDLNMLAISGRKFVIAFDKDTKPKTIVYVEKAAKRLANLLEAKGCEVTFASWDSKDGKGIDDLIFNKGADAFINAIESAGSRDDKPNDPPVKNPPALSVSKDVFTDLFKDVIRFDASVKQYWKYNGKGMWIPCSNESIFYEVSNYIEANVPLPFSPGYVENVIKFALGKILHEDWTEMSSLLYIPFSNGVLEMATKQLLHHSPDYGFTWQLPRTYSSVVTSWGYIDRFLNELTNKNQQLKDIAIAFCNAVLTGRSDLQKFLYLFGSGGNGKGALASLLEMLVGKENTHSTTIKDLNENRFEAANIRGKRLVRMNDEDKRVGGLSVFKSATGGDPIRYERKGKDAKNFVFTGIVVVAANNPTFVGDSNYAIKRRKVDFPCIFRPTEIRDLTPEFEADLPAFTTYLLSLSDEWVTATIRGADNVESVKELNWEMTMRENPIAAFYNDRLIIDPNGSIGCLALYSLYKSYCDDSGNIAKSIKNFTPLLLELCKDCLGLSIIKKRTNSGETIRGLRLRKDSDEKEEEREEDIFSKISADKEIYPTHPTLLAQGELLNPTLKPTPPYTTMHYDKSNMNESEPLTEF